jgi:hypothetical protein
MPMIQNFITANDVSGKQGFFASHNILAKLGLT